ncbi:MAG: hypothetical protein QM642_07665 [Edaphocola sp.]
MNLRAIYIGIPVLALTVLNLIWGSAISWMLCIAIAACLLYYFAQVNIEQLIYRNTAKLEMTDAIKAHTAQVIKKYKTILSFSLLTIVFLASAFTIYKTANPGGKHPWFFNNDYHALSNTGIAFDKDLQLHTATTLHEPPDNMGISHSADGSRLAFNKCYVPVFADAGFEKRFRSGKKEVYTPLNNIFPVGLGNDFTIANQYNKLTFHCSEADGSLGDFFKKGNRKRVKYTIDITSTDPRLAADENISLPFRDAVTVEDYALEEGKTLYNFLLNNRSFNSGKSEGYAVLNYVLQQLGNTYLLANHKSAEEQYITLFPDRQFFENGYRLGIGAESQQPMLANSTMLPYNRKFYVGFHNTNQKAYISKIQSQEYHFGNKESAALMFDYPPAYWLSSPSDAQRPGDKNVRFIANNTEDMLASDLREGFDINTYGLKTGNSISGTLDFLSQKPNVPLAVGVADNNAGSKYQQINDRKFSLQSSNADIRYLFAIRDYSDNGFGYGKLLWFAAFIYLGMLFVLIYFPGKGLVRIEPVLFVVIYTLVVLRFILCWRLATFPPVEDIGKYELENTIIDFDYRLGVHFPIPLTLIWVYLFLAVLVVCRWFSGRKLFFNPEEKWRLYNTERINRYYLYFMGGCLGLFLLNDKMLHIEILTRVSSIIVPLTGYCYFAMLANKHFVFRQSWISPKDKQWFIRLKAYVHYFINNPSFLITLSTIAFFAITDRGFAILFTLFVLLKNIFTNFLKKTFNSANTTLGKMLLNPNNYWAYGIAALATYLTVLSFKSLFYYLLTYKLVVIGLALSLPAAVIVLFYKQYGKVGKIAGALAMVFWLLLLVPPTRNLLETATTKAIRHVQYRASIIHQPIGDLLSQNPYSSFQTQKIIETAENQWFINAYTNKHYDNSAVLNLRPYSKVGVDYNTQTRDVVIARFVIGEMGSFTMYLILILCLLPLVLYLISYRLTEDVGYKLNYKSYAGAVPLLIFFTLALFVWLTATNRFVFFGQDFPFLSVTSRLAVVLPLILLGITLTQQPVTYKSYQLNLRANFARYVFFAALVAGFALTTIKSNELGENNFSVTVPSAKQRINNDLNGILAEIQDSLDAKGKKYTYAGLMKILAEDKKFKALTDDSSTDAYTKSLLKLLAGKPSSALKVDNPLYIVYDNHQYTAMYNDHLYMQLPPVENRKVWNGSVAENLGLGTPLINVHYGNQNITAALPCFRADRESGLQMAVMPAAWFVGARQPIGIFNLQRQSATPAALFIYKKNDHNIIQNASAFATTCNAEDVASVNTHDRKFTAGFTESGNYFAVSKWVNGAYRILYPLKEHNFWLYHFANAIRSGYSDADSMLQQNVNISLDYKLSSTVQSLIDQTYSAATKDNKRFRFSVMAADGNGNIRMMNDYVTNRMTLDPNDMASIARLQQQHFFFSDVRNERDQWGNSNLIALHLGPGSSVKPLTTAAIASQVNAGWQLLHMAAPVQDEYNSYAGFKLLKPWKNDDHYRAGYLGIDKFIEVSSNFYQSAMIFLGSYPKAAYVKNGRASIANVLSAGNSGYPMFEVNGKAYYLPSYQNRKTNWPATGYGNTKHLTFFGNENSVLANGLEVNAGLRTKDKDKIGGSIQRANMIDSFSNALLQKKKGSAYLWSMPEESTFLQSQRSYADPYQNFNVGIKTTALGGYPYLVTPYKMLEMYLSLFTQNRSAALQVMQRGKQYTPWQTDDTWAGNGRYNDFLSAYIFKGMHDVIYGGSGTAHGIGSQAGQHPGYYFYAKTGTINEQGSGDKNSRRLIVAITNRDLQQSSNVGNGKVYLLYFAIDNNKDFDWTLLNNVIDETMASASFLQYFK